MNLPVRFFGLSLLEASFSMRLCQPHGARAGSVALPEKSMGTIGNNVHYFVTLTALLAAREIDGRTWLYAARHRPVVVSGRSSGWVVDQAFRM